MEERAPRHPAVAAWTLVLALALAASPAPGAEIRFAAAALSVAESTPSLTVELDLTAPECAGQVRVPESVVVVSSGAGGANPATLGADFAGVQATVPLGVTGMAPIRFGRTLSSLVLDDTEVENEGPETFLLTLTLPAATEVQCLADGSSVALAPGPPLVVSIEDDEVPSEIVFSQSSDRVAESQGAAAYSLLRQINVNGAVTATLAASSQRVSIEPAVLTWADGEGGARDFTVTFGDDDVAQGDERVAITLDVDGADTGQPDRLVITIVDDDRSTVAFTRAEATVDESAEEAVFALRRTGRSGAATATLRASSTAVEIDPPAVSWGAGETGDRPFTVRFMNDNRDEDDRVVVLSFDLAGNAEAGAPSRLAITIDDDDDAAGLVATGGGSQIAAVGADLAQPLVVLVTNQAGQGVEGVAVSWSVAEGDAMLTGGAETMTGADGQTSNRLRIGGTPGRVRVRAEIAGSDLFVDFVFDVLPSDPVAEALARACRTDDDLNGVCGYFRGLPVDQQLAVIEEIRPEEVAAQVNVTQDAPRVQLGNVGARLAALRRAGTSSGVQQLALNVRGLPLNPHALATAMTRRGGGGLDPVAAVDRAFAAAVAAGTSAVQDDDTAPPPSGDGAASPGRLGFYVNGSASFGDRPGTALETGFDFDTLGLTAGLDYRLKAGLFVGGALGYLDNDTDLDNDGGTLATEGVSLSLYLMRYWEKGLYLQAVAGYGENDHDQVRNIDLVTPFRGRTRYAARGRTDGTQTSFAAELGYDASRGAWTVGGYGRASYVETDVDRFSETGDPDGSGFYLEVFDQSTESLLGEGGVNVSYAASYSWGVLLPQGRLSYLHEFEDGPREIRARFIEDTDPTNIFAIPTEEPDRDYFNVGVGLGAQFQRGVSAFLFYDTDLDRADLDVSTLSAGVRFEF